MSSNQKKILHKLLVFTVFLIPFTEEFQPQLELAGNNASIASGSRTVSEANFTDFGITYNKTVSVNENQIERTFVLTNTGNSDLVISEIRLDDDRNFFEITTNAEGTLAPNESANLTINYTSHSFGLAFAEVIIESNDSNGPFRFFVRALNIECNSLKCFGTLADDANACNGKGTCLADDVCSCVSLYTGTQCQTAIRWSDGTLVAKAGFDFTPRIFIGPELNDPNQVYSIKIRIDGLTIFPGSKGISIGLGTLPSDMAHDIGANANEYGFLSTTGEKFSNNALTAFGAAYGVGDTILIEYDAPNNKLSYAVQKAGTPAFVPQGSGPAFTITTPENGESLYLLLSVTCFGSCEFQYVT
ncbi:DUF1573 domain-containing protein [uncultured Roseivirga sp.]|uniref:Ig-like domain-containing protein n=1 Tax=uncultured Roseivirga sp. TaxID=543088 RepID=UPI00258A2467|nr:DUF1573 domain-containing protein [uncultured Roseivirga sp.]|tara:strand:+ start:280 stop:1353 length:1074 start_codon:yes stop_codon:yes gene_type:complete